MGDELLLRFTEQAPCWTRPLLLLAGEESDALEGELSRLLEAGLLLDTDNIYCLTDAGRTRFASLARECYFEAKPGEPPQNPAKSLAVTRLWLELERSNRQAGGEKRYLFDLSIPVRPAVKRLYTLNKGRLRWLWPDAPDVLAMREKFPGPVQICPPVTGAVIAGWREWQKDNCPEFLKIDLLLLCHYDMIHYLDFTGHPNDNNRLINTDRFAFIFKNDVESCLQTLGKYQMWLEELRLAAIPGYLDKDTQQQDSANWLLFVCQDEERAVSLADELAIFGEELIRPAKPMELWTISMENLERAGAKRDVIWELLPFTGHAVWPRRKAERN